MIYGLKTYYTQQQKAKSQKRAISFLTSPGCLLRLEFIIHSSNCLLCWNIFTTPFCLQNRLWTGLLGWCPWACSLHFWVSLSVSLFLCRKGSNNCHLYWPSENSCFPFLALLLASRGSSRLHHPCWSGSKAKLLRGTDSEPINKCSVNICWMEK